MKVRLLLLRHDALRALERAVDGVWFWLPARWRNVLTAKTMGHLVAFDERLHQTPTGTITVDGILGAMKVEEGRPA